MPPPPSPPGHHHPRQLRPRDRLLHQPGRLCVLHEAPGGVGCSGGPALRHGNRNGHVVVTAGEDGRAGQVGLRGGEHRHDVAEGVGLAGRDQVHSRFRALDRDVDQGRLADDLAQVCLLRAALRHDDAQAVAVYRGDAGDRRILGHQERGLEVEHGRAVVHRLGAVGGDADEGGIEPAIAEGVDHGGGILELDQFDRHAGAARQGFTEIRDHAGEPSRGFVLHGEVPDHQHADAQLAGRRERPHGVLGKRLRKSGLADAGHHCRGENREKPQ